MTPGTGGGSFAVVEDVAASLADVGSLVWLTTVAVLENCPVVWTVTTMLTVALAPSFRMPRVHETVAVPLHAPWLADDETKTHLPEGCHQQCAPLGAW